MKLYWYCLTFRGYDVGTGNICYATTYTGQTRKGREFSMREIAKQKLLAGVRDCAVLISVSYLGHMTKDEFAE